MNRKKIIIIICAILLLTLIISLITSKRKNNLFVLDKIYNVYPEEVKKIYQNMVDVDCNGDLYFDIDLDKDYNISDIDSKYLLTYMFSYLEKNKLLDNIDITTLKNTQNKLFQSSKDIVSDLNNFSYGNHTYKIDNDSIVKDKYKCVKNNNYVSYLYSYMYDYNNLYIDVSIGYEKEGILYNFLDEELGSYDGDKSKLAKLMNNASYYRLYYVKKNGLYKLAKIKWMSLSK